MDRRGGILGTQLVCMRKTKEKMKIETCFRLLNEAVMFDFLVVPFRKPFYIPLPWNETNVNLGHG